MMRRTTRKPPVPLTRAVQLDAQESDRRRLDTLVRQACGTPAAALDWLQDRERRLTTTGRAA